MRPSCLTLVHRLGLGGMLATLAAAAPAAELTFDPALAASPPAVSSAQLAWLATPQAGGNALLRVRFKALKPGGSLVVQGGRGPTPLRDDGQAPDDVARDGVYTALLQVDRDTLRAERDARARLATRFRTLPRFADRTLLRWVPFDTPLPIRLDPGVAFELDKVLGVPGAVDPERELLIRQPVVVEDPLRTYEPCTGAGTMMGAWTFGRLATEIANQPVTGIDPALLVEHWLWQWKNDLTINGLTVPGRAIGADRFLSLWPRLPDGRLDLARAPFRLLAIVNRLDLRTSAFYGGGDAGEARLVFGAVNCGPPVEGLFGPELPFTVIFEYGVPRSGCQAVRDWARQWRDLGGLPLGSPAYNTALQALTDQFTLRDLRPDRLPNRSALNQLRSNEAALAIVGTDAFWQLRESRLISRGTWAGWLLHAPLAQTPRADARWSPPGLLRDFVNAHTPTILDNRHLVPMAYPAGMPLRGGHADIGAGRIWDAVGIVDLEARRKFSLAACDACHSDETSTHFVHIAPRPVGAASALSNFLTGAGMPMSTPVSGELRTYHDLLRRQEHLHATASMSCKLPFTTAPEEIFIEPVGPAFTH